MSTYVIIALLVLAATFYELALRRERRRTERAEAALARVEAEIHAGERFAAMFAGNPCAPTAFVADAVQRSAVY